MVKSANSNELRFLSFYFSFIRTTLFACCFLSKYILNITSSVGINKHMYIDIKPYFYLPYRLILKYPGMRCFPVGDLIQTLSQVLVVSQNVNTYGSSVFAVIVKKHDMKSNKAFKICT